ncbi:MAG: 30S ribosome-binding factor RbfA [Desulfuromonadaceae bacterium]
MSSTQRSSRVGEQIQKEIADLLLRGVRDPRVGFVTITAVDVTSDLQHARVYYTTLSSDEDAEQQREDTRKGLESATKYLRTELGKRIKLRRVPELSFRYDESTEYGNRIEDLLRKIKEDDA